MGGISYNVWLRGRRPPNHTILYYYYYIKNKGKYSPDIQIKCEGKPVNLANETKFLGLYIINYLSWKTHAEYITAKLSSACYAVMSLKPYVTTSTLRMMYYSYFHSIMTYGILFWGNFPDSQTIFTLQKKMIRIMMGCRPRGSCRELFSKLEILPLPSQHIFSLLLFMMRNQNLFSTNSQIYHINTRQQANLHLRSVNVTKYQKGVYFLGIKVFNALPSHIKTEFNDPKRFKQVLHKFLHDNSFYSLNKHFEFKKNK
jgi:hypothetical protein